MRERLSAKLGNSNDNAFKLRKLFKVYDKQGNGLVRVARGTWHALQTICTPGIAHAADAPPAEGEFWSSAARRTATALLPLTADPL